MTFRQAGILTSKAMGVVCAVAFIHAANSLTGFLVLLSSPYAGKEPKLGFVVAVAMTSFLLYLSLTLWFAAGRFVKEEPTAQAPAIQVVDIQRLAFRFMGLYFAISSLTPIVGRLGSYLYYSRSGAAWTSTAVTYLIEDVLTCSIGAFLYFASYKGIDTQPVGFIKHYFGWFASPFSDEDVTAPAPEDEEL